MVLELVLKNGALLKGATYSISLAGLKTAAKLNPALADPLVVVLTTPTSAPTIPSTCGASKNKNCLLTPTLCTFASPCTFDSSASKYFIPNPTSNETLGAIDINPNGTIASWFFNVYVDSLQEVARVDRTLVARSGLTSDPLKTAYFGGDGALYLTDTNSPGTCNRVYLSPLSAPSPAFPIESACTSFAGTWMPPTGFEITTACTSASRCALDGSSVYYAQSPYQIDSMQGIGLTLSNSYKFPSMTDTIGYSWYSRTSGTVNTQQNFPNGENGVINHLSPVQSAYWQGGYLFVAGSGGKCIRFGDGGTFTASTKTTIVTCP